MEAFCPGRAQAHGSYPQQVIFGKRKTKAQVSLSPKIPTLYIEGKPGWVYCVLHALKDQGTSLFKCIQLAAPPPTSHNALPFDARTLLFKDTRAFLTTTARLIPQGLLIAVYFFLEKLDELCSKCLAGIREVGDSRERLHEIDEANRLMSRFNTPLSVRPKKATTQRAAIRSLHRSLHMARV